MEWLNELLEEQRRAWMQNTQHPLELAQGMIYGKILLHRLKLRTHK